jgi:peptidoglycan-N-acetylglucosamine deacetylase
MPFFHTPNLFRKFYDKLVWSFIPVKNEVYLTFDDGPNEEITKYILCRLQDLGWQATFFCVGENVKRNPLLFQQIQSEGHAVGNHTQTHLNAWKVSPSDYIHNVTEAAKYIQSSLFRPPYGRISKMLIKALSKDYKIIMWSFMTYDFNETISHQKIEEKAKKYIQPGAIIVLHDNEKFAANEKAVFEIIVKVLQEKGLVSKAIEA